MVGRGDAKHGIGNEGPLNTSQQGWSQKWDVHGIFLHATHSTQPGQQQQLNHIYRCILMQLLAQFKSESSVSTSTWRNQLGRQKEH